MKFHVKESELNGAPVGLRLGVFTRAQIEEQGNLDKIVGSQGELAVGVSCFYGCHEESNGGSLIPLGMGLLVSKVLEHASETRF